MASAILGGAGGRATIRTCGLLAALGILLVVIAGPAQAEGYGPAEVVRIEADDGDALRLVDRGRYEGSLEFGSASAGIVVNELSLEAYLVGVDEMPSRWQPEALRAQAIAARTYAWYSIRQDSFDGYDLCATTSCQVYRGLGAVEDGELGTRWLQAVEDTEGQVLLHDDAPILARYFSTSGGRTVPNEVAFPSSGPRPYLVGIDDPYDEVSPYHRWTATFTREEFDTILARGDTLAAAVPVAEVERLGDVDDPGATVRVTAEDGASVEVGARELREFLSRLAPDSFPDRFPGARADGLRSLPTTVPSSRFAPEVTDDEVILHGRGWGHAVGLGQYGANARAADGQDHREILAAYYDGLEPTTTPELPSTIRVGLEVDAGATHRVAGTGAARLVVDGEVAQERAIGTWTFELGDDGWRVSPPDGYGQDLEVSATELGTATTSAAGAVTLQAEVNKPVVLRVEVTDADGAEVSVRDVGAVDAGEHAATWRAVDDDGAALPSGDYRVALVGEDEHGASDGAPVTVTVDGDAGGAAGPLGPGTLDVRGAPLVVIVAAVLLVLALVTLGMTRRRST